MIPTDIEQLIEIEAHKITSICRCHEAYKSRDLIDPSCTFHEFNEDIRDACRVFYRMGGQSACPTETN